MEGMPFCCLFPKSGRKKSRFAPFSAFHLGYWYVRTVSDELTIEKYFLLFLQKVYAEGKVDVSNLFVKFPTSAWITVLAPKDRGHIRAFVFELQKVKKSHGGQSGICVSCSKNNLWLLGQGGLEVCHMGGHQRLDADKLGLQFKQEE